MSGGHSPLLNQRSMLLELIRWLPGELWPSGGRRFSRRPKYAEIRLSGPADRVSRVNVVAVRTSGTPRVRNYGLMQGTNVVILSTIDLRLSAENRRQSRSVAVLRECEGPRPGAMVARDSVAPSHFSASTFRRNSFYETKPAGQLPRLHAGRSLRPSG